ncbi:MAG: sugar transferase [Deltaproteobacteria bacterium]|nr:sugar transferase [Deltaproteobacteria bacterium]
MSREVSIENRPLLVHIATVPEFFHSFFQGQLEFMVDQGFEVVLICSPGETSQGFKDWPVRYYPVSIERRISPLADIISIWRIVRVLRSIRPDIVHVHTSKAGLLGMIAAWITAIPVKIFTIHGFRWVTKEGMSRRLIKFSNRLTSSLADRVFCVSKSNLDLGIGNNICSIEKAKVVCKGSINGVDAVGRFNPEKEANRLDIRKGLGIPENSFVFGFVGRIVRDKGIKELAAAWRSIRRDFSDVHLMLVGKAESGDPVSDETLEFFEKDERVHFTGFCPDVAPYYGAMDAFVLPSYREGFPVTPLEASAMGLPVIASNIRGCADAVVDGQTGILVAPGSSSELEHSMRAILNDREMAERLGGNGRKFVLENFQPTPIWQGLTKEYKMLLKSHPSRQTGLPLFLKRVMDFIVIIPALILLFPVMAVVAILVWANLGFPVIFREKRIGEAGKPFWFLKFRTMTNEKDSEGNLFPDEERLSLLGRFFRATSLDELPQLINVLKGEMSLVGPRPLPMKYLERFSKEQRIRHTVLPGITGLTAISYRGGDRSWEEKFEYDVRYVLEWHLLLDWKILFRTFWIMGKKAILNRTGKTTSEEFRP